MDSKSAGILKDYELSLEDLTFNSKPIINMLTMLAEKHKSLAPQIVELIETRFFKVKTEHRLPTLYLLDSIIKNLGGDYLQVVGKKIVQIFCEAFQCLTDAKIRISLYKLRQTWIPYLPIKKLAAIDQHIHSIDPNWPITAKEDPLSPTIFVNPKFIGATENKTNPKPPAITTPAITPSAVITTTATTVVPIKRRRSPLPSKTTSNTNTAVITNGGNSLQEKRRRLQESLKQKKLDKKRSMGLIPAVTTNDDTDNIKLHPSSMEFARSLCPIPKKKKRSLSPVPPDNSLIPDPVPLDVIEKPLKIKAEDSHIMDDSKLKRPKLDEGYKPINALLLDLDDLPSELFEDHQAYILQQAKKRLKSGNLSVTEHNSLVEQVEQLYNLQKLKNNTNNTNTETPHNSSQSCKISSPPPQSHSPPDNPPHSPPHTLSIQSNSPPHKSNIPPPNPVLHPHPHSPPHHPQSHSPPYQHSPPHYSSVPPPPHYDDNFPPRRLRGGPRHLTRGNYRPPHRYRGVRGMRSRPSDRRYPPTENREFYNEYPPRPEGYNPRPQIKPEGYEPPLDVPPQRESTTSRPSVDISTLYKQLEQSGLFSGGNTAPPPNTHTATPTPQLGPPIPDISLTIASIKRRYNGTIDLLSRGEPCTSCGMRFTEKDNYQKHLDWHYKENRMDKEGTKSISRNWYLHIDDWLTLDEVSMNTRENDLNGGLSMEVDMKEESVGREDATTVSCQVLPDEDSGVCTVCHELLEQFWEEEEEEWHFKGAIRDPHNQLFHSNCYIDYKETLTPVENKDLII